eukprot:TRINITY_DN65626_c13_g1_i1.p1 TRINITY_DN65626_c13_g1~~TRINITY_DN65626_c13_g1_i1.p1  ORF type:complete len:646 (-),score=314.13 TRINITY_DN65626_c13_g1_i1:196-2133(-)
MMMMKTTTPLLLSLVVVLLLLALASQSVTAAASHQLDVEQALLADVDAADLATVDRLMAQRNDVAQAVRAAVARHGMRSGVAVGGVESAVKRWLAKLLKHISEIKDVFDSLLTKEDAAIGQFLVDAFNQQLNSSSSSSSNVTSVELRRVLAVSSGRVYPDSQFVQVWVEALPFGSSSDDLLVGYVSGAGTAKSPYKLLKATLDNNSTSFQCDKLAQASGCKCGWEGHCARGSMQIDPWIQKSLKFQHALQRDETLNNCQFLQTHNAYNNRADGYGLLDNLWGKILKKLNSTLEVRIANQEFSITDQLRMGVRSLELDLHWFNKKIRLCHSHGPNSTLVTDIVKILEIILHRKIDWDLHNIGCGLWDRPYELAVAEINTWIRAPGNEDEVLVIYHEDNSFFTWGHDELVNGPIQQYYGDLVLTPADKANKTMFPTWPPTPARMVAMGKRIFIASDADGGLHGGEYIHVIPWTQVGVNDMVGVPVCQKPGNWSEHWTSATWLRTFGDKLCYPPIEHDCTPATGWVTPSNMKYYLDCNPKLFGADMFAPVLSNLGVWSWDEHQPPSSSDFNCTIMQENGRWARVTPAQCPTTHLACQSDSDPSLWTVSSSGQCGKGFVPSHPVNARQNYNLWSVAKAAAALPIVLTGV